MGIVRHGPHGKSGLRLLGQSNSRTRRGRLRAEVAAPAKVACFNIVGTRLATSLDDLLRDLQLPSRAYETTEDLLGAVDGDCCGCVVVDHPRSATQIQQLQSAIKQQGGSLAIVVCVERGSVRSAVTVLRSGAFDVLEIPLVHDDALACLRSAFEWGVAQGQAGVNRSSFRERFASLSQREQEVMIRLASNQSNQRIATELGISPKTVGVHRSRIMVKMETDGVVELTKVAHRMGLVE